MAKDKKTPDVIEGETVEETPAPRARTRSRSLVKQEVSVVAGLALSTKDLKKALDAQTEQRQLIADFVKKHLVKGVDFIQIHVVKNCRDEDNRRGSCKQKSHFSKDILAKPGQEKIFSLFQLTSELVKDEETIEMLQGERGLVAYKCLVKRGDQIVAEGRGACRVGDNRRDVNATIKIAEKRARMDACLSLGFSEYFAQDLDDPDYQTQKKAAEDEAAARADDGTGLPARAKDSALDEQERLLLAKWLLKRGFDSREEQLELLVINGVTEPKKMTSGQARDLILKLKNSSFAVPANTNTVLDDIDDLDEEAVAEHAEARAAAQEEAVKKAELDKDPELVVDDDFKAEVEQRAKQLPLNARGHMWLMQKIGGRPFAKWEQLKDADWRRAYDLITAILDQKYDVEDFYLAGVIPTSDLDATVSGEQGSLISEEEVPSGKSKQKTTSDVASH